MFGFRKNNSVISSLPITSKKRKSPEDIISGSEREKDILKPIPIKPKNITTIYSTPINSKLSKSPTDFGTPINQNTSIEDDFILDNFDTDIDGQECLNILATDLQPLSNLVPMTSEACKTTSELDNNANNISLESYHIEFNEFNTRMKSILVIF